MNSIRPQHNRILEFLEIGSLLEFKKMIIDGFVKSRLTGENRCPVFL
jgi:hypothetical protein